MRPLESLLRQLEAYVQEEIGAQGRMLVLLEAQEQALLGAEPGALLERSKAPSALLDRTRMIDAELAAGAQRAQRRAKLLEELASVWSVAGSALTLASIVERSGAAAERLDRQRGELRDTTARVARKARNLGSAARTHQRVTAEAIELLLAGTESGAGGRTVHEGGVLVDAEA